MRFVRTHPALTAALLATLPRLGAWVLLSDPLPTYHYWLSEDLLRLGRFGGTEPTSYIEPLPAAVLALLRGATGSDRAALFLQILVASTGAAAIWRLTRTMSGSVRAAWIAAAFYGLDPYFVRQAISYTELSLLLPVFLWSLERIAATQTPRGAVVAGAALGFLVLVRAAELPLAIGAPLLFAWRGRRQEAGVMLLATLLILLPWTVRSYIANGALMPTRGGENLFVSTSEFALGVVPRHDIDLLMPHAVMVVDAELRATGQPHSEVGADRILRRKAIEFVRSRPVDALRLKLANLLWIPAPVLLPRYAKSQYAHAARMADGRMVVTGAPRRPLSWEFAHAVFRSILLVAALVGLWHRRLLRGGAILLLALAVEALVHTVFFPTTRLLSTLAAVQMVYGGLGAARLSARAQPLPRGEAALP